MCFYTSLVRDFYFAASVLIYWMYICCSLPVQSINSSCCFIDVMTMFFFLAKQINPCLTSQTYTIEAQLHYIPIDLLETTFFYCNYHAYLALLTSLVVRHKSLAMLGDN